MGDILKVMYENEKNHSRVFEIHEHLFKLKQGDRSVLEFYEKLTGLIDELEMHRPAVTNVTTLRGYHQDLAVPKFLFSLSLLRYQVRDQILGENSIPIMTTTFSRVMRVFTGADVSPTLSIEQLAMISRLGRGRGSDCDFGRGRGSFGGDRGSYGGRHGSFDKGPRQCKYCRRNNHIFEKCWEKFGLSKLGAAG